VALLILHLDDSNYISCHHNGFKNLTPGRYFWGFYIHRKLNFFTYQILSFQFQFTEYWLQKVLFSAYSANFLF